MNDDHLSDVVAGAIQRAARPITADQALVRQLLLRVERLERIVVHLADSSGSFVATRPLPSDTYEPTPDEVQALWSADEGESVQLRFCRCVGNDHDEDCYKRYR